jgi:hypothetical protein
MTRQIAAIVAVFIIATIGWFILGGATEVRSERADHELRTKVGSLWGTPLVQSAPTAKLTVTRTVIDAREEREGGKVRTVREERRVTSQAAAELDSSDVELALDLDQRRKGLLWYSTYRVHFVGRYGFRHPGREPGTLTFVFAFPSKGGVYDGFVFTVDGEQRRSTRNDDGTVETSVPSGPGDRHTLEVAYVSHGLDSFVYRFADGITEVRHVRLVATTDFDGFDFPDGSMSATEKIRSGRGWRLTWTYADLITGSTVGVEMPHRLDPGPVAARISFFAPVSLGFFFFLIFVIGAIRGIRLHPMHYFFLACAFFAFHLLLAYLADHVVIEVAFALSAACSLGLAVSYMHAAVGPRFAFREVAIAQMVYLVGFSAAFFVDGFTGLTVTIGAILTLFLVMQLTARVDWGSFGAGG